MANTSSAIKEIRVARSHQATNKVASSETKSSVRQALTLLAGEDKDAAVKGVRAAEGRLDKAAAKGIIHKNAAARRKSRLVKKLNKANAAETK